MHILELLGFEEILPIGYQPQPEPRDLRPPVFTRFAGRKLVVDASVLEPLNWGAE